MRGRARNLRCASLSEGSRSEPDTYLVIPTLEDISEKTKLWKGPRDRRVAEGGAGCACVRACVPVLGEGERRPHGGAGLWDFSVGSVGSCPEPQSALERQTGGRADRQKPISTEAPKATSGCYPRDAPPPVPTSQSDSLWGKSGFWEDSSFLSFRHAFLFLCLFLFLFRVVSFVSRGLRRTFAVRVATL